MDKKQNMEFSIAAISRKDFSTNKAN